MSDIDVKYSVCGQCNKLCKDIGTICDDCFEQINEPNDSEHISWNGDE